MFLLLFFFTYHGLRLLTCSHSELLLNYKYFSIHLTGSQPIARRLRYIYVSSGIRTDDHGDQTVKIHALLESAATVIGAESTRKVIIRWRQDVKEENRNERWNQTEFTVLVFLPTASFLILSYSSLFHNTE